MTDYNLELDKAAEKIKQEKANTVLIQLPDGLKPGAKEIQEELKKITNAKILIWAGSCFGACDVPKVEVDLIIQFGHSGWV
ncbi:diphthamide synthesis protein [Candidatus Woesearchaeota archaeon]|nr:diphthamide synthesis protein [Candidatus Woesearchaeota archaeon]